MTTEQCQAVLDRSRDSREELERDEFHRRVRFEYEDGDIVTINQKYLEAQFEWTLISQEKIFYSQWPIRCETEKLAQDLMADPSRFKEFSVPFFIVTRPDGTTYESW